jgi:hypothetical protein
MISTPVEVVVKFTAIEWARLMIVLAKRNEGKVIKVSPESWIESVVLWRLDEIEHVQGDA